MKIFVVRIPHLGGLETKAINTNKCVTPLRTFTDFFFAI